MSSQDYSASWLAKFLHSFPHLDLTFHSINSTFSPHKPNYRESLLFWAAVPVIWLLVTLLVFLMYFCYRCCQRDAEKQQPIPCLKWTIAVFTLLTCAAIGVGFYGNEEMQKGLMQFTGSLEDTDDTISSMKDQVYDLQIHVNESVDRGLRSMRTMFERRSKLSQRTKKQLAKLASKAEQQAHEIYRQVSDVNNRSNDVALRNFVRMADYYGYWRWLGTLLLFVWKLLLCLLLLFGIANASKCTLLLFCALGIFTLVLCWMAAGLHLGTSVGSGDFCIAPDKYFESLGPKSLQSKVIRYYLRCDKTVQNPFSAGLKNSLDSVSATNRTLQRAASTFSDALNTGRGEVQPYVTEVTKGLGHAVENLQHLTALVQCTNLHKDYTRAIKGICSYALPGVVFVMLSCFLTGMLFTLLVILASRAWRHFGKSTGDGSRNRADEEEYVDMSFTFCNTKDPVQTSLLFLALTSFPQLEVGFASSFVRVTDLHVPRPALLSVATVRTPPLISWVFSYAGNSEDGSKGYVEVDEDDPFIPRPDNSSPSYYSFTRGRQSNPREHMPMHRRSSPPPAYNTNEFYRQYSHMNDDRARRDSPIAEDSSA